MGLWLKCPKCQAANPLDLKSCQECNASLENLPATERVYILGNVAPAAPKAAEPAAPKAAAPKAAAPKATPAQKPAAKAKPKAPSEEMDLEVVASTAPPPRRAKGPKGRRKKKQDLSPT